jgi:hypothetical protein
MSELSKLNASHQGQCDRLLGLLGVDIRDRDEKERMRMLDRWITGLGTTEEASIKLKSLKSIPNDSDKK